MKTQLNYQDVIDEFKNELRILNMYDYSNPDYICSYGYELSYIERKSYEFRYFYLSDFLERDDDNYIDIEIYDYPNVKLLRHYYKDTDKYLDPNNLLFFFLFLIKYK
jgi:hypothetical protein